MTTLQGFVAVAATVSDILHPSQNKLLRLSLWGEKAFYKGEEEVTHEISGSATRETELQLRQLYVSSGQPWHNGQLYALEGESGEKTILIPFWLIWTNFVQNGWYGFQEMYNLTRITGDSGETLFDRHSLRVSTATSTTIGMATEESMSPYECWDDAFLKPFHDGTEKRIPDCDPSFFFLREPHNSSKLCKKATPCW